MVGATTVDAGTLVVNGSIVSPVTVNSGAVLAGTGIVSVASGTALTVNEGGLVDAGSAAAVGALTVAGNVSFASSAIYRVNVVGSAADRLAVLGTVSGGPVTVNVVGSGSGPWLILSASQVSATFTTSAPGLAVTKRNGTEVWLGKHQGTCISVY